MTLLLSKTELIKAASILDALKKNPKENIYYRLIHTGQHYDDEMSSTFFKQLKIPLPDINLNIGSGSRLNKTGKITLEYEKIREKM